MFASRTVRFPPTTTLVVPFATPLTFAALDFVRVPETALNVEVDYDFGDGTTGSSTGTPGTLPTVNKTYDAPGRYTLRIQVRADTTLWQRYQWPVQVACSADDFAPSTSTFDFLAAVHASLELPGGRRQLVVPLPAASSIGYGSYPSAGGGTPPSADAFSEGVVALARVFQQSFALGFGRIRVPRASVDRAVYAHLGNDLLAYGTSSCLQSDISLLESALRDVMQGPSRTDAMAAVKSSVDALSTLYSDIRTLGRLSITAGDVLISGSRSILLGDVESWYAYATTAVDEDTEVQYLTTRQWRQLNQEFDRALPAPNWASAWYWEANQAIAQAVIALYAAMGVPEAAVGARAFLLTGCDDALCSLRIYDEDLQFWAQVSAAPTGPGGHLTLRELGEERSARPAPEHPSHVAVRAVGVRGLDSGPCTDLAYLFDATRIEASLDGRTFAKEPTFMTMPTDIAIIDQVGTNPTARQVNGDGSVAVGVEGGSVFAFTVGRPAMALPSGKDTWSALTPHALLSVFARQGR
ncbi:MAG: PKD domain-containing protein [Deltaproteobacteria bacterium]|nr:PKD domain-containing protein [Deltaproteobacteria bacterium]